MKHQGTERHSVQLTHNLIDKQNKGKHKDYKDNDRETQENVK